MADDVCWLPMCLTLYVADLSITILPALRMKNLGHIEIEDFYRVTCLLSFGTKIQRLNPNPNPMEASVLEA